MLLIDNLFRLVRKRDFSIKILVRKRDFSIKILVRKRDILHSKTAEFGAKSRSGILHFIIVRNERLIHLSLLHQ